MKYFNLSLGYWLPLTVVVVLQPAPDEAMYGR